MKMKDASRYVYSSKNIDELHPHVIAHSTLWLGYNRIATMP